MIFKKAFKSKKISCIGIGCLHFGTFTDYQETEKIVNNAIDNGINYFDTAPMYGNGLSEKYLGKILKNNRSTVMVGTKVGLKTVGSGKLSRAVSLKLHSKNINQSLENSLKSLKTDYIDYFQLASGLSSR